MPDRVSTMPSFFPIRQRVYVSVGCFCEEAVQRRIGSKEKIRCRFQVRCLTLKHLVNSISLRCSQVGSCTITGCTLEQVQCREEVTPILAEL